ncbi:hypothetical protein NliqN6_5958 [Naganishia liquefaciens]|uniref:C2H2-type domain-containing protein n=1 Tax=Naganishia liquefaciens TaxID=104408 RepID=A0A8H3TZ56_9TREE|nr:hypothetical protein NliqN6_5958 [Naganishia liquefaciens]
MANDRAPRSNPGKCPKCNRQFSDLLEHARKHTGHVWRPEDFVGTDLMVCGCGALVCKKNLNRHYARNIRCNARGALVAAGQEQEEDEMGPAEGPSQAATEPIVLSDSDDEQHNNNNERERRQSEDSEEIESPEPNESESPEPYEFESPEPYELGPPPAPPQPQPPAPPRPPSTGSTSTTSLIAICCWTCPCSTRQS